MKCLVFLCLLCASTTSGNGSPKVIIVGSGPAGIAAASRLIQNGIDDVRILEAENRFGGRIKTVRIGEYSTDMGAQWVHGEVGNVGYELAAPFDLVTKVVKPGDTQEPVYDVLFVDSSGTTLPPEGIKDFVGAVGEFEKNISGVDDLRTGSYGEYLRKRLNDFFGEHPEIQAKFHKPLTHSIELVMMAIVGAESADDVSALGVKNSPPCFGWRDLNWKEKTYSTILDILMKRYPNADEELPVLNKIVFNKRVIKINSTGEGPVKVITADGTEYTADHVIFTGSLGVLKADHEKIFEPPLPEKNKNAIERIGMGKNGKILIYHDNPWWTHEAKVPTQVIHNFLWTEDDRKLLENDPERAWMLGLTYGFEVEWRPKLFQIWLSGAHLEQMEKNSEELFKNQTLEILDRFFGNMYNLTEPTEIQRSSWNTNENFRGSYSYQTMQSVNMKSGPAELGEPVMRGGIPVVLFAGEATEPRYYSMVHGAIGSGWREADRLINLYREKKSSE
ncbi:spermine oxidase [Fopius arisanus]|uniref:Smox_0 protein n=1 Tax=Fopius arisanus TaxID=64838 RepID=A0A0C9RWF0_9HYME|nr:PREDICTED: spermine oxidase-like [Fopius arisanus]